jgi:hypothetical protein
MPTYTIAGKRVTSPEPLSDEEIAALYSDFTGAKTAAPAPAAATKERFTPELPRDIRTPQDVDVRRGASGLLGLPGGLLDIATGIAGIGGENAVTRWLREKERSLAAQAPSQEGYEAGKIVPQIVPAATTAKVVSKIPAASAATRALLQAAGQAGQAYAVTPSASEDREQMSVLGLGPRESAAVVEGGLGLAGEAAAPLVRRGIDFSRTMRDRFADRITGLPTTPVTEQERAALAISQRLGPKVSEDELSAVAKAQQEEATRREELAALKTRQAAAEAAREQQRQALIAQKKAAQEAEAKALETVELTPTRGKQELGQRLRDTVMAARKKYMDERAQAIGKFESGDEVPVFTVAKEKEAAGQFISKTDEFKDLVKFLQERGVGRTGKSELDREEIKAFRNVLRDITPKQRISETVIDEAGNKAVVRRLEPIDITFNKLEKLRRRIAAGDPGVTETGFKAIIGDNRKELVEKISKVMESFSPGYLDYKKAYAETSEPLDFLKVNTVGKKATGFQKFSQEEFQSNPESVLDALLNNPSKTNADNLLKFVGNEGKDDIEQVVLEALVDKAGGKAAGYTKVLEKYDDFLNAFPSAKKRLQDEATSFEKATAPARSEFEAATSGLEKIKTGRAQERLEIKLANAAFKRAEGIRVAAQDKIKARNQIDEQTLIDISEAANKIPLDTSLGLSQAAALAAVGYGASELAFDSPLGGLLGIAGGLMRRKAAKNAFATKKKEVADRIETELRKIISDQTGARGASIQKRIDNEADIMSAQRLANQALSNLGIKPGTGAVTTNAIYKAFASDEGAEPAGEEPSQAEEEEVVSAESGSEPEPAAEEQSYDIDSIIAERDAGDLAPLIKSIYEQESSSGKVDTSKQNYAGAKGPMQVTKDTFDNMKDAGMLPEDYSFDNVSHLAQAGVVLIQDLARRYDNDPEKIAAAYYGGPKAVTKSGIRREQRDKKNPKAPTVGEYADQVLARLMPTAQAEGMAEGGLVEPGNIDVSKLPAVRNADGTYSTVRSMGVNINGKEVLIPTVINGRVVSEKEAINHYLKTGKHLGVFSTPEESTAYAEKLHQMEAQRIKKARGGYTLAEELLLRRYANR